jgi:hypothetical protein
MRLIRRGVGARRLAVIGDVGRLQPAAAGKAGRLFNILVVIGAGSSPLIWDCSRPRHVRGLKLHNLHNCIMRARSQRLVIKALAAFYAGGEKSRACMYDECTALFSLTNEGTPGGIRERPDA